MQNLKNYVQLIGNLGKDPELVELGSGKKLAKVTIATNEYFKNDKGEKVQETQWHNLVAWGNTAENIGKILKKGNEIAIRGKLTHRTYEDKQGQTKYISEIIVNEFVKLTKSDLPF